MMTKLYVNDEITLFDGKHERNFPAKLIAEAKTLFKFKKKQNDQNCE
jgi:hypothetical protein